MYDDNSQDKEDRFISESARWPPTKAQPLSQCKRSILRVLSTIRGQRNSRLQEARPWCHDDDTRGADLVASFEILPVWWVLDFDHKWTIESLSGTVYRNFHIPWEHHSHFSATAGVFGVAAVQSECRLVTGPHVMLVSFHGELTFRTKGDKLIKMQNR